MKKIYSILLCIGLVASFVACEKDKDFALTTLSVANETITPWYESAQVSCSFKADATISEACVQYALSSSFVEYKTAEMAEEKGVYSAQLTDLQSDTMYYVRYVVSNKYSQVVSEAVVDFRTLQPVVLKVVTKEVKDVDDQSATVQGEVTSDGGAEVTERGVVYGTSENPTVGNSKVTSGAGIGAFTCNLTGLQPNTKYYVRVYAVNSQGTAYGEQVSFTTLEEVSATPEYVDLGLSVKWATFNVGATKPEEYGDYFAWGETEPKEVYNWSTYKWCKGSEKSQTKYCTSSSYGTVDNKTVLEAADDAARANWGGSWRMPTKAEQDELRNNCTWTWTTQNGVNGYKVTGTNGNSIFLPAAGCRFDSSLSRAGSCGYCWSSSLNTDYPYYAYGLYFSSSRVDWRISYRYYGQSVRPVCP